MRFSVIPYPEKIEITPGRAVINHLTPVACKRDERIVTEGYRLIFNENGFTVFSSDKRGEFYAFQTIKQITAGHKNYAVPFFEISDSPKFSHRGFMLDCARHSFSLDEIKKVIDAAAMLKMNKFHWHLTDDQGWRIEIKSRPELMAVSSRRKKSTFGDVVDNNAYCAFFTQEQIKDIVNYCAARYIEVIPEIDMPGHTSALLAAYPELSCSGEKCEVETKQGIFKNVLCVSNEKTYDFLYDVLDEVCELFPGRYIHIGGDETPTDNWQKCPHCSKMKEEKNLASYSALQGWFTKYITDYLKFKGKQAIVWNESLKGDYLGKDDIIVQRWMDKENLSYDFANKGGKIIESDFFHYYFDYPFAMTPLKKAYRFSPHNKLLNSNGRKNVVGVEAELWTEFVRNFDTLCIRLFPRICAVAETAWCKNKPKYKDFEIRQLMLNDLFEQNGIKIVDLNEWNPNPISSLAGLIKFYKTFVTADVIKDFFIPDKKN